MQATMMAAAASRDRDQEANIDNETDNRTTVQDKSSEVRPDLVINVQPQSSQGQHRAMLPVSTTDWHTSSRGQFIPVFGLDFLIGVSSLVIQQTVELSDLTARIDSENRYIVKVPNGEALYIANEVSSSTQRCLCGSGRALRMHIYDNTRQEALQFERRLAGSSCCFPYRLQEMIVISPPGDYLGRIQQQWTILVPFFLIRDPSDNVLYIIEGPVMKPCISVVNTGFKILSGDALREEGRIVHSWDGTNYTTTIDMPDRAAQPKHKALLLAATFLMEYTYFEKTKSKSFLRCNCY